MQFLPKDVTTLSATPSAYKLFLDLKEDDDEPNCSLPMVERME